MKKISLVLWISSLLLACSETKTGDDLLPTDNSTTEDSLNSLDSTIATENLICLFEKTSLTDALGKNGKWIQTLTFGRELQYLADSTIDKKKYYKVRLIEGTEGWVNGYNVQEDSKVWITTQKTVIYTSPDPLTISDKQLDLANLVVIKNEKLGDFYEFVTLGKKQKGYLKGEATIANDPNALEAGLVFRQIMAKTDPKAKEEALVQFQTHELYSKTSFAKAAKTYLETAPIDSLQSEDAIEEQIIKANQIK